MRVLHCLDGKYGENMQKKYWILQKVKDMIDKKTEKTKEEIVYLSRSDLKSKSI